MKKACLTQDQIKDFFAKYSQLTGLQKRLFKLLHWYSRRYPAVFASHERFAQRLNCNRETVCRMMRKFLLYGWVSWRSRGKWDTNEYTLLPGLVDIDLSNNQCFARDLITPSITPSTISNKNHTSKPETGGLNEKLDKGKAIRKQKLINIPERIDKFNLPYEIKLKLSMVPEGIFQNVLDSAKWKHENGWVIRDQNNYVAGAAIRMAQQQGIKLDWPAYYASMRNYQAGNLYGT